MRNAYRALVVEDEPRILKKLAEKLGALDARFEVVGTARNGLDALALAHELLPDVVFSDVYMPRMDGIALSEQLKARLPGVRVVIISGFRDFDYARDAMRNGVSDYLLKPVSDAELVKVLARVAGELARQVEAAETAAVRAAALGQLSERDIPPSLARRRLLPVLIAADRPEGLDIARALHGAGHEPGAFFLPDALRAAHRFAVLAEGLEPGALLALLTAQTDGHVTLCAPDAAVPILELQSELHMLTSELCRQYIPGRTQLLTRESFDYAQKTANDIEAYLKAHFAEDLSVESIAEGMGFHAVYLNRIFKKHKGLTIIQYLINLRIDLAKRRMAENPSWDLALVGQTVGYNDPHYFSRAFKKSTGQSPSEWRDAALKR